ncbi:anaerobic sulfite reductase subunit A [Gottschalkia purinilytica]|uniref:Anaerobic sulfite reductase subunit A n=1 Tax=Gottschalkia purinilytica TaxID=1503 RepID=A0A0L0WAA6_GOTPU|nr:anaerobic sulfite reductase subunit AsrA [Gottschalkia purinilytica]KNF08377.1 anaerobic sulfite reductase subunit A [Gottschalkia purinilytica]
MGYSMVLDQFNNILESLKEDYKIFAPKVFKDKGTYSDTDMIRYGEISSVKEIEFDQKSYYSAKELILPITQTLFYFTEDNVIEPKVDNEKGIIIFLRSCDINAIERLDEIYLRNGQEDPYYKKLREKVKLVLIECKNSFENCFCVSMGSNKTEDYSLFIRKKDNDILVDLKDDEFLRYFETYDKSEVLPNFIESNEIKVNIPANLGIDAFSYDLWEDYSSRCISCGRCSTVCGTCSCFTMQDIFYSDNLSTGERRRVWASCQIDGYTTMAGGHEYRKDKGERMRFKTMHKIYDFNKRFGYQMCVGCGRCDDACPEYISFSHCINKLDKLVKEVK